MSTDVGLCRTATFRAAGAAGDDGLTLTGTAAVFDQRELIDSWEGTFYEQIRKGAFRKTIREQTPVLQFDHGRHSLIGSIPIGRISELTEDDEGLQVTARLSANWLIEPVRDAIRDKAVTGMSFRFDVVRQEWRDNKGKLITDPDELRRRIYEPGEGGPLERTLIELRCPELGPVVFPAYTGTTVGVRAGELAGAIRSDETLTRQVRAALADDTRLPDLPADPALRAEVARAVLFGTRSEAPTEPSSGDDPGTDAPPAPEAPVTVPDAPPAPEGHPSPSDAASRKRYARLAYVTRESVGKKYADA